MAQNMGIKESWSFMEFASRMLKGGKMQLAKFSSVDEETGEISEFKKVVFLDKEKKDSAGRPVITCFLGFSQKLGELSVPELIKRKNELRVVQLESGNYKLCEPAESMWEDIDLGL